jgi:hypothetical protein
VCTLFQHAIEKCDFDLRLSLAVIELAGTQIIFVFFFVCVF